MKLDLFSMRIERDVFSIDSVIFGIWRYLLEWCKFTITIIISSIIEIERVYLINGVWSFYVRMEKVIPRRLKFYIHY